MNWWLPWRAEYPPGAWRDDLLAGLMVTVLIVPQSLAYALLAGLPPYTGLIASVLPAVCYGFLGRSSVLAVGPVAVTSLMTFTALSPLAAPATAAWAQYAMWLALLSGVLLLLLGLLRFGFLSRLLSFPVLSGFSTAAALLILNSQWRSAFGFSDAGWHVPTAILGLMTVLILWGGKQLLSPWHWGKVTVLLLPVAWLGVVTLALWLWAPIASGIATVGVIEQHIAYPTWVWPGWTVLQSLLPSAAMIALMSMVASLAVAKSLGRARGETPDANAELRGLGMANLASAASGSFPVAGGFSRSAVYAQTGARSPLAGMVSGLCMLLVILFFTPALKYLPVAVLSAAVMVAALSLLDWRTLLHSWRYDRADASAWLMTAGTVLVLGLEAGIVVGIVFSLGAFLWRASQPHVAVVGRVPHSTGFRNIKRHAVETRPGLLMLRIDESLFFGNIEQVRELVHEAVRQHAAQRVVLWMTAVNAIDETALEGLGDLAQELQQQHIQLELAEVKGPVQDRLSRVQGLSAVKIWFTAHEAYEGAAIDANSSVVLPAPP
ncbi:MAG: STAS domain-containing protein [Burkholderiales bacterium]|nr:STAS domain-containing protein [Burkholderiales bacterium]